VSKKKSQNQRSETARKAAEVMRAQQAQTRRRTVLIQAGVAVAAVIAVLLVTVAYLASTDDEAPAATPSAVDDRGAFVVGNPDAPVTVEVVEDFQCPACQAFEQVASDLLTSYAEGEEVNVAYRGIAFLDRASSTDYSSRALNASACVMAEGEDVWTQYHRTLFAQQPPEGGAGLTDEKLIELAVDSGADEDGVRTCVEDRTYADWARATTQQAGDDGVNGTPTVFVNGEELDENTPEAIGAAVDAAS
jgi:protein-disulfide isomerase